MSAGPQARLLPGGRLHLQHGPIDLIVKAVAADAEAHSTDGVVLRSAKGASRSTHDTAGACFETPALRAPQHDALGEAPLNPTVMTAYRAAAARFSTILTELCEELPILRAAAGSTPDQAEGVVARRMMAAVAPFAAETFITPMAAVAGAVAEEILRVMIAAAPLRRASVNNGGDIALHLAPGDSMRVGLVDRPDRPSLFGTTLIRADQGIGGIATSGWRGRSFSLGIADAVTILARTAAEADAAATIVANAVDCPGHPAVLRRPAREVQCDSDLGNQLVVRDVGSLVPGEIEDALSSGLACAEGLIRHDLIAGAALHLQGRTVTTRLFSPRAGRSRVTRQRDRMRGAGDSPATAGVPCPSPGRTDVRLDLSPPRGERQLGGAAA